MERGGSDSRGDGRERASVSRLPGAVSGERRGAPVEGAEPEVQQVVQRVRVVQRTNFMWLFQALLTGFVIGAIAALGLGLITLAWFTG